MKIDEPDTPWASPPRELFEDPITEREGAAEDVAVAMDDVADRLRDMDDVGRGAAARRDGSSGDDGEWAASSDGGDQPGEEGGARRERTRPRRRDRSVRRGGRGGGGRGRGAQGSALRGAAQEPSVHVQGVMARGRAMLEEEEEEEEDAQGGMGRKPEEPF